MDVMMAKYMEMDEESLRNFESQDGIVEGIGGFRLLRGLRRDENQFPGVPPWIGLQVQVLLAVWVDNPLRTVCDMGTSEKHNPLCYTRSQRCFS